MSYTVKYKIGRMLFWRKLRGVQADGIAEEVPSRWFGLENGRRYEIPLTNTRFVFSKERAELITKQLEEQNAKSPTA